ncbi:hypothetical protein C8R45DRAFT_118748 [Mycena sanguinolenta]|nr:hypothetical protein C8R45DRAFT_118748 [Mycena sanguinolenta]
MVPQHDRLRRCSSPREARTSGVLVGSTSWCGRRVYRCCVPQTCAPGSPPLRYTHLSSSTIPRRVPARRMMCRPSFISYRILLEPVLYSYRATDFVSQATPRPREDAPQSRKTRAALTGKPTRSQPRFSCIISTSMGFILLAPTTTSLPVDTKNVAAGRLALEKPES